MSAPDGRDSEQLLGRARQGDGRALGELLDGYRNYLQLLARLEVDGRLQSKVDPSDLVQEAFVEVHRSFGQFRGTCQAELLAWLRRILISRLVAAARRFLHAQARDVRLERQLEDELDQSARIAGALAKDESTPSEKTVRHEQAVLVSDVLEQLAELLSDCPVDELRDRERAARLIEEAEKHHADSAAPEHTLQPGEVRPAGAAVSLSENDSRPEAEHKTNRAKDPEN